MRIRLVVASLAVALVAAVTLTAARAPQSALGASARESRIPAGDASLYVRELGRGQPIVVLHGGPDFDHAYLLPDMDRLANAYRLIYYDQRGRGRSADGVRAEDVTLASDVDDIDKVREHFRLTSTALLGHSWGAVLALEYALRHPSRVSHLILMNPAPASAHDVAVLRKAYLAQLGTDMQRQREIVAGAAYQGGDPEAVAARYRIHFTHALKRPEDYEKLIATMKTGFLRQGKAGIVKARAVEDRLMNDTWNVAGYDLMPKLASLRIPTVVIWGDYDFIPMEISTHIARAIPSAQLVTLEDCGHFAYLECADDVREVLRDFFQRTQEPSRLVTLDRSLVKEGKTVTLQIDSIKQQKDWQQLFNGRDLDDWVIKFAHHDLGVNLNETFRVDDGLLKVRYDKWTTFDREFGHIFYKQPFSYYVLAAEYRFVGEQLPAAGPALAWARRNNGLMLHAPDPKTMLKDQDFPISIEVQLLGGLGDGKPRTTANLCTPGTHVVFNGALYTPHCTNSKSKTYDGDQWVRVEVLVHGDELVRHMIDGQSVLEYTKPQIGGGAASPTDPAVKVDGTPLTGGYIALQAETAPIDFRKVELLNLEGCTNPKARDYKAYFVKSNESMCRY